MRLIMSEYGSSKTNMMHVCYHAQMHAWPINFILRIDFFLVIEQTEQSIKSRHSWMLEMSASE